ncbi:hypothetical protein ABZU75_38260 [Streptosporangium sp. NPDC005286]|uniref:hypothetical protein n=1 Tax=Streptosporangium sp. NPDC005286 TaxID=3154463 RepID=UPI0033A372B6
MIGAAYPGIGPAGAGRDPSSRRRRPAGPLRGRPGLLQIFIPELISLWWQGRFPFDRLIRTYPLGEINDAERDSLSGATIKPVLLPGS